jgi:hypothetical protein
VTVPAGMATPAPQQTAPPLTEDEFNALKASHQQSATGGDGSVMSEADFNALKAQSGAPADGENVDANDSVLSQLGHRGLAAARTLVHGALSIPAGIIGLPSAASKLLSNVPITAPAGLGMGAAVASKELGAAGDAVEPVRAGLQGAADAIAPKAAPNELGLAAHPAIGNALSTGLDVLGGVGAGAGIGGIFGKVGSMIGGGSAAPETRLATAVSSGIADAPAGTAVSATAMPADYAPSIASWARRQDPAAARVIEGGLRARSEQQFPAIAKALGDATGIDVGSLSTDIPQQISSMKATAAPLYDQAYASPDITDPRVVQPFLKIPRLQEAYAAGNKIAEAEGNPLPPLPKGNGQPKWVQQMADVLGRDPTPEEMQSATANNPSLANQQAPGISVRALDYAKRGLNDIINGKNNSAGVVPRGEARALQNTLRGVLSAADESVPAFGQARQAASQGFGLDDAASQARQDFASHGAATPEDVGSRLESMPDPERRIYTQAAIDQTLTNVKNLQGSATGRADLASKLWSSIGGRGKLTALVGDPDKADALGNALEDLASQQETMRAVTGGSQTAEKLATDNQVGGALSAAHDVMGTVKGNPVSMLKLLGRIGTRNTAAKDAAAARQLAPMLVQQGPDALSALQAAAAKVGTRPIVRAPTLIGAGIGGAATAP